MLRVDRPPGSLRPPGSDTYVDRRHVRRSNGRQQYWRSPPNQLRRIDYFGTAPHYKNPSGDTGHRSGPKGARYHPAMLSGVPGGPGGTAPRILIVDDDPNLLVLLADQLRSDGYEIATARDGEEALRRLQASWPDLLIIDMMMPRMDGLSLAREIKSRADLPIIVLSAIDASDSKADLLEEVAEDYITKPYHYPELRARINRVMRRLGDKVPRQSLVLGADLTLDLYRREATVGGTTVQLTPTESRLLYALAANIGQTVSTETPSSGAGPRPRTPTPPTSGSRCAVCARRSRSTRTTRSTS